MVVQVIVLGKVKITAIGAVVKTSFKERISHVQ